MNVTHAKKSLALLVLAALAACSGGSGAGSGSIPAAAPVPDRIPAHVRPAPVDRSTVLARIAGVGDSLSAGYQAGGFLGATGVKDPLDPGVEVRPGQENGFWALLVEQASGQPLDVAIDNMYDPAGSPLPLIAGPGLDNQLVPAAPPAPFGPIKPGDPCKAYGGFNAAGFRLRGLSRVRMNPYSTTVRDLAVPGITLHEANVLYQPQTPTCEPIAGVPGLLSAVVNGESGTFWPVLGNFAHMNSNLSMVKAAASLRPTLTTVWLGANDVLKFMGSGGRFTGGDQTAGQTAQDLTQTIDTLIYSGSQVVVANLPNVVQTPYFMRVTIPKNPAKSCTVQTYVFCLLLEFGFGQSQALAVTTQIAATYHLATPSGCVPASTGSPCGYLTLQGSLAELSYYLAHGKLADLDNGVPGSGLGQYYITPSFAGRIQLLNDNVNEGIVEAAHTANVPLVDIRSIFEGIASGNPANPYFRQAVSISPGTCCTLAFGAGLVSFDGLHPSNTGYAVLAYNFIKTINKRYGTHIPEVDVTKAYNGTRCSNKEQCFPDEYAPPNFIPLKTRIAQRLRQLQSAGNP
jgi:lysophospholipase L1-like esterase